MNKGKKYKTKVKKASKEEDDMMVPINSDYDYVIGMVKRIHRLSLDHPDKSFNELDDLIQEDEELNEFSHTHTSIYLVLTKTDDPKRFSKMYSLVEMKRKMVNGQTTMEEAMRFIDHLDFSFEDI